jgi:hypothetical protein
MDLDKALAEKDAEIAQALAHNRELVGVIADERAEIARLRSGLGTLGKTVGEGAEVVGRYFWSSPTAPEQPRKVTDAQREAIKDAIYRWWYGDDLGAQTLVDELCHVIESTDEPARGV